MMYEKKQNVLHRMAVRASHEIICVPVPPSHEVPR